MKGFGIREYLREKRRKTSKDLQMKISTVNSYDFTLLTHWPHKMPGFRKGNKNSSHY